MITIPEAQSLDKARLTPAEESAVATIMKKVDETIREHFDGLGTFFNAPASMATTRAMVKACGLIRQDGWIVSMEPGFEIVSSKLLGGKPTRQLVSWNLIIAVDSVAEYILRIRRDTSQ